MHGVELHAFCTSALYDPIRWSRSGCDGEGSFQDFFRNQVTDQWITHLSRGCVLIFVLVGTQCGTERFYPSLHDASELSPFRQWNNEMFATEYVKDILSFLERNQNRPLFSFVFVLLNVWNFQIHELLIHVSVRLNAPIYFGRTYVSTGIKF
jgi:hypothetical protein